MYYAKQFEVKVTAVVSDAECPCKTANVGETVGEFKVESVVAAAAAALPAAV